MTQRWIILHGLAWKFGWHYRFPFEDLLEQNPTSNKRIPSNWSDGELDEALAAIAGGELKLVSADGGASQAFQVLNAFREER